MKVWKKMCLLALSACLLAMPLTGCGGGGKLDPEKTLTVWTTNPLIADYLNVLNVRKDDKQAQLTKYVVDKFHESYPDVTVNLSTPGWGATLNEALMRAKNSRSLPDIIAEEQYLASHKALGCLLPIVSKDEIDEKFPEFNTVEASLLEPLIFDDKVYSAPVFTGTLGLFYNENLLRDYNVKRPGTDELYVPTTFAELFEASGMLYRNSNGEKGGTLMSYVPDGSAAFRALGFLRQAGAEILDKTVSEDDPDYQLRMNSKEYKSVMDYLNLLGNYSLPSWAALADENSTYQEFYGGNAGFMVESNTLLYNLRFVVANKPHDNIKMIALPSCDLNGKTLTVKTSSSGADGRSVSFASDATSPRRESANVLIGNLSYSFGNNTSMQNPEKVKMATDFLKILYTEEFQGMLMGYDGRIPVVTSVLDELIAYTATVTDYDRFIQQSKTALSSAKNDYIPGTIPSFVSNPKTIWQVWTAFFRENTKKGAAAVTTEAINAACDKAQSDVKKQMET